MKKKRILALAIIVLIELLSMFCLIWLSYKTNEWKQTMDLNLPFIKQEFGSNSSYYIYQLEYYKRHFTLYILSSIASGLIFFGNSYLFVYILKNDFSLSKDERERKFKEKAELRKQAKREKLQHKLDELNQ